MLDIAAVIHILGASLAGLVLLFHLLAVESAVAAGCSLPGVYILWPGLLLLRIPVLGLRLGCFPVSAVVLLPVAIFIPVNIATPVGKHIIFLATRTVRWFCLP